MYLALALLFGALPWLLWHELPVHGHPADATDGGKNMLLFAAPDNAANEAVAAPTKLRGAAAAAAVAEHEPLEAAAPQAAVKQVQNLARPKRVPLPPAEEERVAMEEEEEETAEEEEEEELEQEEEALLEMEEEEAEAEEELLEELEQDDPALAAEIEEELEEEKLGGGGDDDDDTVDDPEEKADAAAGVAPNAAVAGSDKAAAAKGPAVKVAKKAKAAKVLASSTRMTGKEGHDDAFVRFAPQDPHTDKALATMRRERVKVGMKRAWDTYHAHAWGKDTVLPLSKTAADRWGGMAMTMLDSLSTLWVMGLKDDFMQARDWIAENLSFKNVRHVSVFETNIRALAGLLSAYDLSQDKVFLDKAVELGDLLLPAFDSKTGFPINGLDLMSGQHSGSHSTCLAEFGTMQIEFRYLSHVTGNPIYAEKAMHVFEKMHEDSAKVANHGVFKLDYNADSGGWGGDHYSVAARGDSFYEYLLKTWLQGNKKETWLREMFDESVDGIEELLLVRGPGDRLYIANNDNGHKSGHMEHLACFYPGTLALASASLETKGDPALEKRAAHYMDLARELGETCYQFTASQATGLAPDSVTFDQQGMAQAADPRYILRPEIAESMYYLHLLDGDPKWREYGANMFEAIDTYCRTDEAYAQVHLMAPPSGFKKHKAALRNAGGSSTTEAAVVGGEEEAAVTPKDMKLVNQEDEMESFFLAETLKYLYLIQETEPGEVDLSRQVFNTEAHPLRIFSD